MDLKPSQEIQEYYLTNKDLIPNKPGIYKFLDSDQQILYIGKAKNLKKRISSYFNFNNLSSKNILLFNKATSIDWIITKNETESLLLERSLISEHKPKFNILLKYGDGYLGVALSKESDSKIFTWRGVPPKKADWFGPFPNVSSKDVVNSLLLTFPVRSCNDKVFKEHAKKNKPCLLFEAGMCFAPCIGNKNQEIYNDLKDFLSGKSEKVLNDVQKSMSKAASEENFEYALLKKRQLESLKKLIPDQDIVNNVSSGLFITYLVKDYLDKKIISFGGLRIENNSIIALQTNYALVESIEESYLLDLLNQFLVYFKNYNQVFLSDELIDIKPESLFDGEIKIKGFNKKKHLFIHDLLEKNINLNIQTGLSRKLFDVLDVKASLDELSKALKVENVNRIECIDISHTLGAHPVASIVVMQDGVKQPKEYRRLNIPVTYGGDDVASIKYTLYKRFSESKVGLKKYPDVILIDGGKPQCNVATEVINELFAGVTPKPLVISIAKRMEEIFKEGSSKPIILSRDSESLKILMTLRDQAHNHAIKAHRNKRDEYALLSIKDELSFLPAKTLGKLLQSYPTREALAHLSIEDLLKIEGITKSKASRIIKEISGK